MHNDKKEIGKKELRFIRLIGFIATALLLQTFAQGQTPSPEEIRQVKVAAGEKDFLQHQVDTRKNLAAINKAFVSRIEDSLKVAKQAGQDVSGLALGLLRAKLRLISDEYRLQQAESLLMLASQLGDESQAEQKIVSHIIARRQKQAECVQGMKSLKAEISPLVTNEQAKLQLREIVKQLDIN